MVTCKILEQSLVLELSLSGQETIAQLKDMIKAQHPLHPAPFHQRLVSSGRILQDELTLDQLPVVSVRLCLTHKESMSPITLILVLDPAARESASENKLPDTLTRIIMVKGIMYSVQLPLELENAFNTQDTVRPVAAPVAAEQRQRDDEGEFGEGPPHPFWVLLRLGFVYILLAQNGSTQRLVVLTIGTVLIALFQLGWLNAAVFQRIPENVNERVVPQQPLPAAQEDIVQEPARLEEPLWKSFLNMSINFITSLIPGLIQEHPVVQQP